MRGLALGTPRRFRAPRASGASGPWPTLPPCLLASLSASLTLSLPSCLPPSLPPCLHASLLPPSVPCPPPPFLYYLSSIFKHSLLPSCFSLLLFVCAQCACAHNRLRALPLAAQVPANNGCNEDCLFDVVQVLDRVPQCVPTQGGSRCWTHYLWHSSSGQKAYATQAPAQAAARPMNMKCGPGGGGPAGRAVPPHRRPRAVARQT